MGKKLPKGWVETELGNIAEIVTGNTPSKSNELFYGEDFLWVKPGDFHNGYRIVNTVEKLSSLGFEQARKVAKESVLVTCIGNLGKIGIASRDLATNQQINSIVLTHDFFNKKFMFYSALTFKKWLYGNSTSTTISMVNKSIFQQCPILIPPLLEQERIANKLDELFASIDVIKTSMERIPQLLKDFRQQILTSAVTGKLTAEWREGKELGALYDEVESFHSLKLKPIKLRGKSSEIDYKRLYVIPDNWVWINLYKLVVDGQNSICAGPFGTIFKAKDFRSSGIPIIFLRHVKKEGFNQNKPVFMDVDVWKKHLQEYSIYGGELLVTKLGDPPGEATIFPSNIGHAMVTPDVMKAKLNENFISTKFVSYFFNSTKTKEVLIEMSFGITRSRIDLGMFKLMPIPVPSLKEQEEIVKRVEYLFEKADQIEEKYKVLNKKIEVLPQLLLHKAFKGDLVDQLPTDGDAADLLKEIMALKRERKSR